MTHREAGAAIALFVKAYPTQARDEIFQSLMAKAMVESGVSPQTMLTRAEEWIKTERFWPAISDMVAPELNVRAVAMIAPADPIPTERGLEILRKAIR